jgi:hypothetical protein
VHRRSLAFLAAFVAVFALVPAALAARVHVRVEGKTQTIFGATEPTLNVTGNSTVLDALEAASFAGEFYYHVSNSSFGLYVDQIGRYAAGPSGGWLFKVNGVLSQVGAGALTLHDGDTVLWYWAPFAGPVSALTLEIETSLVKGKRCFFATGRDDAGHASRVRTVVFTLNGARIRSAGGVTCTTLGRYAVRVTKTGAIRSRVYTGK